jgi:hypothetical protein
MTDIKLPCSDTSISFSSVLYKVQSRRSVYILLSVYKEILSYTRLLFVLPTMSKNHPKLPKPPIEELGRAPHCTKIVQSLFSSPLQEKKRSERDYNVILNFLRLMLKDV